MQKGHLSIFALFLVSIMPTISILFSFSWSGSVLQSQIFFICTKLWIILIPIYWIYRIEDNRISLGEINSRGMFESIVSGLLIFVTVGLMFLIFCETLDVELMKQKIGATGLLNRSIFFLGVFYWITINSLVEEFVFRQFIGDRIFESTGRESVTILLSAAIFTLHHTVLLSYYFEPWQNVISSLGIFIAGAIWSLLWLRFRSLYVCWISHAIADVAVFGIAYVILF